MSTAKIETLYRCGECREVHDCADGARECCGFGVTQCPSCRREYGSGHISYSAISIASHCSTCNPFFTVDQQLAIEDMHWQATGEHQGLNA